MCASQEAGEGEETALFWLGQSVLLVLGNHSCGVVQRKTVILCRQLGGKSSVWISEKPASQTFYVLDGFLVFFVWFCCIVFFLFPL